LSSGTSHETLIFSPDVRVTFGACEFDSLRHELRVHGRPVPLSPRAFRLLALLLDRRPEVIAKSELLEQLWPGTFVSDASLHNLVAEVRAAIGDTPQASRLIRTVPRCGYGFIGEAHDSSAGAQPTSDAARLRPQLISKRREWSLSEGTNVIGRDPDCAVMIDAPNVSRRHACIVVRGGEVTIEDLGSKNGTYVNGRRVREITRLDDGCRMRIGPVVVTYRHPTALASTMTQRQR
jgi:DNA-binding winged helix-turn-helix (wHTH) protein